VDRASCAANAIPEMRVRTVKASVNDGNLVLHCYSCDWCGVSICENGSRPPHSHFRKSLRMNRRGESTLRSHARPIVTHQPMPCGVVGEGWFEDGRARWRFYSTERQADESVAFGWRNVRLQMGREARRMWTKGVPALIGFRGCRLSRFRRSTRYSSSTLWRLPPSGVWAHF
jgi:hypothetical protein